MLYMTYPADRPVLVEMNLDPGTPVTFRLDLGVLNEQTIRQITRRIGCGPYLIGRAIDCPETDFYERFRHVQVKGSAGQDFVPRAFLLRLGEHVVTAPAEEGPDMTNVVPMPRRKNGSAEGTRP